MSTTPDDRSQAFARSFMERATVLNYKGKKRDDAALDYYCGAATALYASGDTDFAATLRTQAVLLVSTRGYMGVVGIAERLP